MGRIERRKSRRIPLEVEARIVASGDSSCRVVNLSTTGALVVSPVPMDEMVVVRIDVTLPLNGQDEVFQCEAAVVRCSRRPDGAYDLGLYFTDVPKPSREQLQKAIDAASIPASH